MSRIIDIPTLQRYANQEDVQVTASMNVKLKKIIDIPTLPKIIKQCGFTYN